MSDETPSRGMERQRRRACRKAYGATVAVDDVSFAIARQRACVARRERRWQVDDRQAALRSGRAGRWELRASSAEDARLDVAARLTAPRHPDRVPGNDPGRRPHRARQHDPALRRRRPARHDPPARRRATSSRAHFAALGIGDIALDDEIRDLDLAIQQKIEIARAIFREPRILLLDEPTSTLSGRDVDWLGDIIAAQRAKGVTIVFISHRLREVRAFCDTMTVLRNGKHIATGPSPTSTTTR